MVRDAGRRETYPDRKRGGTSAAAPFHGERQYVPYIQPQENGGQADVRWLELRDETGRGLRIALDRAAPGLGDAPSRRGPGARHARRGARRRAETIVHLDAAHRGLGTASCGPDTLPAYLVGPGRYQWSWSIGPLDGG